MSKFARVLALLFGVVLCLVTPLKSYALYPWNFTNGTVADPGQVNANSDYFENKFSVTGGHNHDGVTSRTLINLGTVITGTWHADNITVPYGGTGWASYATGDMLYATSDSTIQLARLAIGDNGSIMVSDPTTRLPKWLAPSATTGYALISQGNTSPVWNDTVPYAKDLVIDNQLSNDILYRNSTNWTRGSAGTILPSVVWTHYLQPESNATERMEINNTVRGGVYFNSTGAGTIACFRTKFRKSIAVNNITVWVYNKGDGNGSAAPWITVNIGNASGTVVCLPDGWRWDNGTIDVSGLTNGDTYDVTLNATHGNTWYGGSTGLGY